MNNVLKSLRIARTRRKLSMAARSLATLALLLSGLEPLEAAGNSSLIEGGWVIETCTVQTQVESGTRSYRIISAYWGKRRPIKNGTSFSVGLNNEWVRQIRSHAARKDTLCVEETYPDENACTMFVSKAALPVPPQFSKASDFQDWLDVAGNDDSSTLLTDFSKLETNPEDGLLGFALGNRPMCEPDPDGEEDRPAIKRAEVFINLASAVDSDLSIDSRIHADPFFFEDRVLPLGTEVDDDVMLGGGIGIRLEDQWSARLSYRPMTLIDPSGTSIELDAYSLEGRHHFGDPGRIRAFAGVGLGYFDLGELGDEYGVTGVLGLEADLGKSFALEVAGRRDYFERGPERILIDSIEAVFKFGF